MTYSNKSMQIIMIPIIAVVTSVISGCLYPCQQFASAIIPNFTEVRVVKTGGGDKDVILARLSNEKKLIKKFRKIASREVCLSLRNILAEHNGQIDVSLISRVKLEFLREDGESMTESLMTGDKICILGDISTGHKYDLTSYFTEEEQKKIIPHLQSSIVSPVEKE